MIRALALLCFGVFINSCSKVANIHEPQQVDYLISNAVVYKGDASEPKKLHLGICGELICYIGEKIVNAKHTIDATGLVLTPGFIDPHTHSLDELLSEDKNSNLNYLTQGVTTVINGNDGDGSPNIKQLAENLTGNGIGTNVALFVGHGAIRTQVMGTEERKATENELAQMKQLVAQAMEQGALGLSSGLYYVPGIYSDTTEVIELAKIAAQYGGIYDTHLRDESTFNIGFLAAVEEAINIAKAANIHLHIAHIKALGVDVWGQSEAAIELIKNAQKDGVSISADQYPWQASGTYLNSAVMPSWVRADSDEKFKKRLQDTELLPKIKSEITENIRRRGGGKALLITESKKTQWLGKNLQQIADDLDKTEAETAIVIALEDKVRVASFNMSAQDLENFMQQPWVLSSSDGTNGHPRKYASFPRKYQQYVKSNPSLTFNQFVQQSSSKTAKIFNLAKRGEIKLGYFADINLIDLNNYQAIADFSNSNQLSTGIKYQFVNGKVSINDGEVSKINYGRWLERAKKP